MELLSGARYRKYTLNERFFDYGLLTEESAYWLGMLTSDGGIDKGSNRIKLELALKDELHVKKFAKDIGSNARIKYYDKLSFKNTNREKITHSVSIRVSSKHMVNSLAQYNVIARKTYSITFPKNLEDHELLRHYLRGIFDGDGCISGEPGKHHQVYFSGRPEYIERLSEIIRNKLYIKGILTVKHNISIFTVYRDEDNYKLLKYMYDDSSVYLDRKYKKANEFISDYPKRRVCLGIDELREAYLENNNCVELSKKFGYSNSSIKRAIIKNDLGFVAEKDYVVKSNIINDYWGGFLYLARKIKDGAAIQIVSDKKNITELINLLEISRRSLIETKLAIYSRELIRNVDLIEFNADVLHGFWSHRFSLGKRSVFNISSLEYNKIVKVRDAIIDIIGLDSCEIDIVKNRGWSMIIKNKAKVISWFNSIMKNKAQTE